MGMNPEIIYKDNSLTFSLKLFFLNIKYINKKTAKYPMFSLISVDIDMRRPDKNRQVLDSLLLKKAIRLSKINGKHTISDDVSSQKQQFIIEIKNNDPRKDKYPSTYLLVITYTNDAEIKIQRIPKILTDSTLE